MLNTSNSVIAKNAITLFTRTIFTIGISLYTSRILLLKLGEDNFGIFSAVGGIAVLFSFINNSMTTSTQRFLTLALSNDDIDKYKKVFTTSLNCHLILSVIILILSETIGLYIVNGVLNINPDRIVAANYAFQFSLIAYVAGITNAPFRASIVAHEQFTYFAYTDVGVKILKLLIVYLMAISPGDKLIMYSLLFMSVSIIQLTSDKIFCHYKFRGCRYIRYWNKDLFKSMISFSGYSLMKSTADISVNQGNNILTNIFGGSSASSSFGLANQVWGTIVGFFLTVQSAFNPQIVKNWGIKNISRFNSLITNASKFSSYMVILIAIPLVVNMHFFLSLWLKEVPHYTIPFCTATIFSCFISSIANPIDTAIMAIGKIQKYQIISSCILILSIPISFIILQKGSALVLVYIIKIFFQICILIYSAIYLKRMVDDFEIKRFLLTNLFNLSILIFSIIASYISKQNMPYPEWGSTIISTLIGWSIFLLIVWFFGLTNNQRQKINAFIHSKLSFL